MRMTKRIPFHHQLEGAAYLADNYGGFLFMEQRTGKTLTALLALEMLIELSKILIVTKSTIMQTWLQEIDRQSNDTPDVVLVTGTRQQRESKLLESHLFYIVNYEMLQPYRVIDRWEWDVVIFDESSSLANEESKVTRYALRAMERQREKEAPMVMCLSGTPAPESPIQYASQFILVKGEYFGHKTIPNYMWQYWHWEKKKIGAGEELVPNSVIHLAQIRGAVQHNCFIRTMEQLNLGSKILYTRRYVELNSAQKLAMRWAFARKEVLNKGGTEIGDKVFVGYLNQIAAGIDPQTGDMINWAKLEDLIEYHRENPEPILALSFFKAPLWAGMVLASKEGLRVDVITGETSLDEREAIREKWQDGQLDLLFGQVDAVKMGIDLSRGSLTWFLSNSFRNDVRDQAEMRTTNVNKKEAVQVVDCCTLETLDEVIVNKLERKEEISDSFLVSEFQKLKERHYEQEHT